MQHSLTKVQGTDMSFAELDREVVDVLPAREEMLANNNFGLFGSGATQQTGTVTLALAQAANFTVGNGSIA